MLFLKIYKIFKGTFDLVNFNHGFLFTLPILHCLEPAATEENKFLADRSQNKGDNTRAS